MGKGVREIALWLFGAIAIYLFISLTSYDPADPGWSHHGGNTVPTNTGGVVGAWFADLFFYLFGYMAYLFPLMVIHAALTLYRGRSSKPGVEIHRYPLVLAATGFVLTLSTGAAIAALHFGEFGQHLPLQSGGILGDLFGALLVKLFSFLGATLFLLALFLTGITLFTGLSWVWLIDSTGRITLQFGDYLRIQLGRLSEYARFRMVQQQRAESIREEVKKVEQRPPPRIEPTLNVIEISERVDQERQLPLFTDTNPNTTLPPLSLLDNKEPHVGGPSKESLEVLSRQVELKLRDFGVEARVVAVHPGPIITSFELELAAGLKVNQVTNLSKDLARALSVNSVRVVEVIPGKPVIGLEIPNELRETVCLSEIIKSKAYDCAGSPLSLALGKDIVGLPVVVDLIKMPHLLVAGTTGSGKSVAVNAMLLSLLYNATARDVRLIMIDPKMLELSIYEGIPHLLTPVVTDMKDAATALRWCVAEMEKRYRWMASVGVRNIGGYNKKISEAEKNGTPIPDPTFTPQPGDSLADQPMLEHIPFIVVVVDELADMMMVVGKKVEQLIARLAQKARASGIHLILATQRPSVDVLTGLIKANIPTRMAFQVSSKIDSRTILDQMGAEQLLGHGDMLYLPPGTSVPTRVHGAFVSDEEVHRVVAHLRGSGEPDYIEEVLHAEVVDIGLPGEKSGNSDAESDPLYDEALQIVTETRRASVSGVQRRLKIGYNRAARLVEAMEAAGVVGPVQSNGSREVLAPAPPARD
ncbi:MAG: DUF87 domain-containing protein [Gammaproteobacteria bacterium]|nr:DUF87 domain-containing protein [Gammaproteobacteria bacterium]